MPVPPITVASITPERLPEVFSLHLLTLSRQLSRGFCKLCHGRVDSKLTALSPEESVTHHPELNVRFECRACGDETNLNAGAVTMDHPAVTSFLFDAGIDLRETNVWTFDSILDPETKIVSEDPLRLRLVMELDGAELVLTLNESAAVISHERRPSG
nr:hypothetical protein [Haloprofundus marisrubri]